MMLGVYRMVAQSTFKLFAPLTNGGSVHADDLRPGDLFRVLDYREDKKKQIAMMVIDKGGTRFLLKVGLLVPRVAFAVEEARLRAS